MLHCRVRSRATSSAHSDLTSFFTYSGVSLVQADPIEVYPMSELSRNFYFLVSVEGPTGLDSGRRVVLGIDDGAQQGHPDLHQLPGSTFTGSSSGGEHSTGCDGHGTMVSSCISSTINNSLDLVGVAPGCYTRGGKIFNAIEIFGFCFGFLESQDSWIVGGIEWSVDIGARITNSSWGGGGASSVVVDAFESARDQGVIHFAAAGNDGSSSIGFPANLPTVNAVSAIASNGSLASFSTSGAGTFVSAPGASVLVARQGREVLAHACGQRQERSSARVLRGAVRSASGSGLKEAPPLAALSRKK